MAFPTGFTSAVDGVTEIIAAHINNLEVKVGIDSDTNVASLDYFKNHAPGAIPSDKRVLFNDGGAWAAAVLFGWDKVNSRVGIGTLSPSQKLDVDVGSADDGVRVISSSSGTAFGFTVAYQAASPYGGLYGNGSDNGISVISKYPGSNGPIRLIFSGGAAGTAATALVIAASKDHSHTIMGSQAGLTTLGSARKLALCDSDGSANNRTEIGFGYQGSFQPVVIGHKVTDGGGQTSGPFYIAVRPDTTNTAPLEVFIILPSGKVGLGTNAPSEVLHVVGNGKFTGTVDIDGHVAIGGSSTINTTRVLDVTEVLSPASGSVYGAYVDTTSTPSAGSTSIFALRSIAKTSAANSQTMSLIRGGQFTGQHIGTGTISLVSGAYIQAWLSATAGFASEAVGLHAVCQGLNVPGSSPLHGDGYGIKVLPLGSSDTFTNVYGLYIYAHTLSTPGAGGWGYAYNFYSAGSTTLNIFEGKVGIGTNAPTAFLDINSDILRLRTAKTPATAGAAGNAGDICWDADYIYVCVAASTWKKAAIATW